MRKWLSTLGTGVILAMVAPAAQADPAIDYIARHIWACGGESSNSVAPGGRLNWEIAFLVAPDEDGLFKAGHVKMFYTLNDTVYSALYTSPGFVYSTVADGTGVYFERLERGEADDISKYELAWLNGMTLIVRTPPGQVATPPFTLHGQLQYSRQSHIDTVDCQAREDD